MINLLLLGSLVIIACILCNRLSNRLGLPMLLAFILLGMVFGSEGLFRIHFDNFSFAEDVCTVALIFIMFYGGFGTRWKAAKPAAVKAILMSSLGTIITAVLTGLFCHVILGFGLLEGLLTGAVLGSTDAASVFSVLRSKKLSLKHHTDSLLELESGSNDPFAYMLTMILLSAMKSSSGTGGSSESLLRQILITSCSQIFFGLLCGIVLAWCVRWFLEHFTFETNGFDTAFILAAALLSYALPSAIGGNGYLSSYLLGILLGNSHMTDKKKLVNFFDGLTSLMQMLIFFILGLLSYPTRIAAVIFPALGIALFLTFIARPLTTVALLTPFKAPKNQQLVVSWAGLRGAASIVFAIMVTLNDIPLEHDLFHIVFCVVLLSISVQGSLLPLLAKCSHMLDQSGNILTTFNDYTDETDIRFIDIPIRKNHPWIGLMVRELKLPPETLLVFLRRGNERIVPNGNTEIQEQDSLVLGASAYTGEDDIHLKEISIDAQHPWCEKTISQLGLPKNSLVIMIRRGDDNLIPNGQSLIQNGDLIVINSI